MGRMESSIECMMKMPAFQYEFCDTRKSCLISALEYNPDEAN